MDMDVFRDVIRLWIGCAGVIIVLLLIIAFLLGRGCA